MDKMDDTHLTDDNERMVWNKIAKKVEDNLVTILENCIHQRYNTVTERTKKTREKYCKDHELHKCVLEGVVRNIKLFMSGQCVSSEQKLYAQEMKQRLTMIIVRIISNALECDEINIDAGNKVIKELMESHTKRGSMLVLSEIYFQLYDELELDHSKQKNKYLNYFLNPNYAFSDVEASEQEMTVEKYELQCHIIDQVLHNMNQESSCNDVLETDRAYYRHQWLQYYKKADFTQYCDFAVDSVYNSDNFQKILDGCMISSVAEEFGMSFAYLWGKETWFPEDNKENNMDASDLMHRVIGLELYTVDSLQQRILFGVLERLTEDAITLIEKEAVNTGTRHSYLLVGKVPLMSREENNKLSNFEGIHFARNKQNRTSNNETETNEKEEYWSVYEYEKLCVEKLLECDEEDTENIFCFGNKMKDKKFQNIISIFFGLEDGDSKDIYYAYCLNQMLMLDSAVELFYAICNVTGIKQTTYKDLKSEIDEIAIALVKLQRKAKCGVGKVVHRYFYWICKDYITDKKMAVEQTKICLKQFEGFIQDNLMKYDEARSVDKLYDVVRQDGWESLKNDNSLIDHQIFNVSMARGHSDREFVSHYISALKGRQKYARILVKVIKREKLRNDKDYSDIEYFGIIERIKKTLEKESNKSGENAKGTDLFTETVDLCLGEWMYIHDSTGIAEKEKRYEGVVREIVINHLFKEVDCVVNQEYKEYLSSGNFSQDMVLNAVYHNIIYSMNQVINDYSIKKVEEKIKRKIQKVVYDDNRYKIKDIIKSKWGKSLQENLLISEEAWEYANAHLLKGSENRSKETMLYAQIQYALINAHYVREEKKVD